MDTNSKLTSLIYSFSNKNKTELHLLIYRFSLREWKIPDNFVVVTSISQMIKGSKEKLFINQIFDENIRRLHQGKSFSAEKLLP